jgi:hypothetical protein
MNWMLNASTNDAAQCKIVSCKIVLYLRVFKRRSTNFKQTVAAERSSCINVTNSSWSYRDSSGMIVTFAAATANISSKLAAA